MTMETTQTIPPGVTLVTPEAGQPCPCGCAPCEEYCCSLDCLVRPRFYCGQLLTDQDLNASQDWTLQKLRLKRYIDGWGVVCGLDICCDPEHRDQVIVKPGYAVSCCGDDIIVCENTPFNLSDACRRTKDPCAELKKTGSGENGLETIPVDLYIRYDEKEGNPQPALGRSVCKEVRTCEPSRVRETFEIFLRFPDSESEDPMQVAADHWHDAYIQACLGVVTEFQERTEPSSMKQWFLNWIATHPSRFCFVRDLICDMGAEDLTQAPRILLWLVQEVRNTFLACACHACEESPGVPLARVWLLTRDEDGKRCCKVLATDPYPPYRRPLSPECWPAPLGQVNVGQVIWHRPEEASARLAALGLRVDGQEDYTLPGDIDALTDDIKREDLFVEAGKDVILQILDLDKMLPASYGAKSWLGQRVVRVK